MIRLEAEDKVKVSEKLPTEERSMILIDDYYANFVKVLDSGKVKIPLKKEASYKIGDFISNFSSDSPNLVLPKNCRYYTKFSDSSTVYVIEEDPAVRTINVNLAFQSDIEKMRIEGTLEHYGLTNFLTKQPDPPYRFNLSFPYIVYIVHIQSNKQFRSLEVFYRLHPLTSLKDYLLLPNLPNISDLHRVCLGGDSIIAQNNQTIHDVINIVIGRFWNAEFNHDYGTFYKKYADVRELSNFLSWSYYSKEDPMFIFNVKWKGYENNIEQEIGRIRKDQVGEDHTFANSYSVKRIHDLLRHKDVHENSEKTRSFSDSFILMPEKDESSFLTVGDSIEYNDKKMYVNAIEWKDGKDSNIVELCDKDDNTVLVKLTQEIQKSFYNQLYKNPKINSVKIGDKDFSIEDLIVIDIPEINYKSYKKISKIRKNIDDTVDILFGNSCYMLNEKTSKFFTHLDKADFNGVKLEKESIYFIVSKDGGGVIHRSKLVKFKDFSYCDNSGSIDYKFEIMSSKSKTVEYFKVKLPEASKYQIYKSSEFVFKPPVFLISNKVYMNSENNFRDYYFHDNNIISLKKDENKDSNKYPNFYDPMQAIGFSLIKNNSELFIPGKFFDIHFKIGDKVVVACWDEPDEMLKVREIIGFTIDDNLVLHIVTICELGESKSFPYIYFKPIHRESTCATILVGSIRHIIPEYLGIKSGQIVVAKDTGIPFFPKKDVNTVIGFINDTSNKIPMMLCSNFCTYWAIDEEELNVKFKFSNKSKKDKIVPTNHTKNIKKIPNQMGDLFTYEHDIIMLKNNYPPSTSGNNMIKVSYGNGYYDQLGRYMCWSSAYRRHGFLTERYKKQDYLSPEKFKPSSRLIPDLCGWYYVEESGTGFNVTLNRRILDVSNISK